MSMSLSQREGLEKQARELKGGVNRLVAQRKEYERQGLTEFDLRIQGINMSIEAMNRVIHKINAQLNEEAS